MIHIDFEKFNKTGLKPIIDKMEKLGLAVANVEADNKGKRESGFLVKSATLAFESGQKLLLKAKAGGSIFQVKLNNKVLAIKNVDDLDKAIKEVIDYVQENEKHYLKQRDAALLAKTRIKVPTIKPASVPVAEQIATYQTAYDEIKAQNEVTTAQVEETRKSLEEKQGVFLTLTNELTAENALTETLQAELEQLKGGCVVP